MVCAIATGFISENSRLKEDTVMGVVFSSMFGVGLVMMTKIDSNVHLDHILFGDVLGISWRDVVESGIITLLVVAFMLIKGKDLLVFVFDRQHAKVIGLPVTALHYGLLLVIAMLIAPGAIAHLLTTKFQSMVMVSVAISLCCSFLGVYLSFFIDSAPAPTIIMLMSTTFIGVFVFTSYRAKLTSRKLLVAAH